MVNIDGVNVVTPNEEEKQDPVSLSPEKIEEVPVKADEVVEKVLSKNEMTIRDIALTVQELRDRKEALTQEATEVQSSIDDMEKVMIDKMEEMEVKSLKFDGIGTFYVYEMLSTKIEEEPQCFAWLKARGYSDAFKRTIHHQTLKRIAKDLLEQSLTIPGVNYNFFKKIGRRT